jgi:predicted TIM-barrel fold metal-dependent hydrolase
MIGCKYHGSYLGSPIHPCQLLEDINLVMVHCGRYKEGRKESNTSYLHALEVAKSYPKLKVIMAHMGGTDTNVCKVAIEDSRDYDNIYFDTSGITTPYIIEYALENIPSNRILFGSDAPWCSFLAMYHTVLDARIPDEDKQNIFYNSFNDLVSKCEYLRNT